MLQKSTEKWAENNVTQSPYYGILYIYFCYRRSKAYTGNHDQTDCYRRSKAGVHNQTDT